MSLDLETAPTFPGSFHAVAPSSKSTSTPSQQPQVEGDWENEENIDEPVHRRSTPSRRSNNDEAGHIVSSPGLPLSSRTSTVSDRASPSDSAISSPSRAQRIPTRRRVPRRQVTPISSPFKQKTPLKSPIRSSSAGTTSILSSTISLLFSSLSIVISVMHVILRPILPYVLLALLLSSAILYLPPRLPSLLLKIIGYVLHKASSSWLDSLAWWPSLINGDRDIALARGLALLPLRGLATPACALTGLACHLSLLSTTTTEGNYIRLAQPVWKSVNQPVDVAGVARNLTKDVKGARDIFESIAMLSEGGMMDRLEYVSIWELGAAVAVGSNLEAKDMVAQQLLELGDDSRDLSDELIDINAMAVNAFSWIQWEFAGLVKTLSLAPSQRPTSSVLAMTLNSQLNRLHSTLGDLHRLASRANKVASRGSDRGRLVRDNLRAVGASLQREHQLQPGWKSAIDKAGHFFVGGEPSKAELISRDLAITEITISSLSDLVRGLEHSRLSIKTFRDQIGYFDASMMGFHMGASEAVGIGPEEEVRVLGEVVEEFGRAIGRAKERGLPENESEAVRATRIEGR